jgi:L-iditol 2-dehydrogenase
MMMRVAQLTQQRTFRIVEETIGDPGPGEVQVRVAAVGLCGSDLHSFAEGAVGDTPCVYPMVLGHEPAGEVIKAGPGVSGWYPGARAAFEPAIYCYHCEFCLSGRHNVCANLRFMSLPGEPGFFRDYANVPARNLLAIPPGMSFLEATLIEPLAVVLHSLKLVALKPGETVLVFGAGPIGWLTVAALKLAGAGRVWVVEPVAHRRELARAAGADAVLDPTAVDVVRQVLADTGQRGVDVAVDCAAKNGSINQGIHAVRNGGRVVITGIPSEVQVPLDFHPLRRKEVAIFPVRRSNHDSEPALEMLASNPSLFAPLLTHSRPLEEVGRAFEQLEHYEDGVGKIAITL